jgi:transposase-like protein
LIASTYLAGTNTRRVRRALKALFGGAVGKDTVSRVWRKVKADWDAWNARSLADEPIVRLILDGTVVDVRLDRKATAISLLVVIGVRADGQKVLLAVKSMGGESAEAWRSVLDDLIARGLRRPELLIVDGGQGLEKAIAAVWNDIPVQRCTVHKRRNLLAHAPERLHDEVTADYTDMIYAATPAQIESRRKAFLRKWRLKCKAVADSLEEAGDQPVHLHAAAAKPMAQRQDHQCDRATARGVQAPNQNADGAAIGGNRGDAVLGLARFRSDQHAKG